MHNRQNLLSGAKMQLFESFEQYAAALGHADLKMLPLSRGRAPWGMFSAEVDGVVVRVARDGGPCLFEGSIAADGVALMLCYDAVGKVCTQGTPFGPRSMLVAPGRTAIQSTSLDVVTWMSLFIPASRMLTDARGKAQIACRVVEVQALEYSMLQNALCRVLSAAKAGAFKSNPNGQEQAAQWLIDLARPIVSGHVVNMRDGLALGRPRRPRAEIIKRACEMVEAHSGVSIRIDDLAVAAGVSVRTLNYAFREQMGVSPQQFVRAYKLNTARIALLSAGTVSVRISDIAARLGVWEWGRFSFDYRRLFGELPSETLQRRKGLKEQ